MLYITHAITYNWHLLSHQKSERKFLTWCCASNGDFALASVTFGGFRMEPASVHVHFCPPKNSIAQLSHSAGNLIFTHSGRNLSNLLTQTTRSAGLPCWVVLARCPTCRQTTPRLRNPCRRTICRPSTSLPLSATAPHFRLVSTSTLSTESCHWSASSCRSRHCGRSSSAVSASSTDSEVMPGRRHHHHQQQQQQRRPPHCDGRCGYRIPQRGSHSDFVSAPISKLNTKHDAI
jgi:hypothetical protein